MWVYILKSIRNGKYYIGQTNNIGKRLKRHNTGKVISTRNSRPFELVYKEHVKSRSAAVIKEKKLKSYKSHNYIDLIVEKGLVV